MMNFDWNYAKAFLAAAEEGSFSQAARRLGLTQPTLSRQIAMLEQSLQLTLFERLTTGIVLTPAGQHLLEHVQKMAVSAQQFSLAVAGVSQPLEGIVSLSVSEIDALFRLPKLIEHIRQQAPNISLDIHVSNGVSDIKRREADIALRSFRPEEPDLIARKLFDEPVWFYGTKELVESYGQATHPSELTGLTIIGFERTGLMLERLAPLGWRLTEANFPVVTSFQGLQWQMAKRGLGLAFFPQQIGDQEPSLVRAFEQFGAPVTVPLWLVTHRELHTNRLIRTVFDLLVEGLLSESWHQA